MINTFPQELSNRIDLLQRISEAADMDQLKMLLEIVIHLKNEKSKDAIFRSPAITAGN